MKAIFVHRNCVLRDSHIDPQTSPDGWCLMPATLEAMRLLSTGERLVFLFGSACDEEPSHTSESAVHDAGLTALVKQVEAAGGRVDGVITCPHETAPACKCWGDLPGILWVTAAQFDLQPNECYVLGDEERDVLMAYAAGARPLIVLCARMIGGVLGNLPAYKDFPIATDLTTAVNYIAVEEEISHHLGQGRSPALSAPTATDLYGDPQALPHITVTSPLAEGLQTRMRAARAELRDVVRWLTLFVLGAVGLSLGIAYLLTHLYRVQPFPEFVYFVTLQFIPRPLRGALFIALGVGAILLTTRSFYRSIKRASWRKARP